MASSTVNPSIVSVGPDFAELVLVLGVVKMAESVADKVLLAVSLLEAGHGSRVQMTVRSGVAVSFPARGKNTGRDFFPYLLVFNVAEGKWRLVANGTQDSMAGEPTNSLKLSSVAFYGQLDTFEATVGTILVEAGDYLTFAYSMAATGSFEFLAAVLPCVGSLGEAVVTKQHKGLAVPELFERVLDFVENRVVGVNVCSGIGAQLCHLLG